MSSDYIASGVKAINDHQQQRQQNGLGFSKGLFQLQRFKLLNSKLFFSRFVA
jgi:hypothetical protein